MRILITPLDILLRIQLSYAGTVVSQDIKRECVIKKRKRYVIFVLVSTNSEIVQVLFVLTVVNLVMRNSVVPSSPLLLSAINAEKEVTK